MRHTPDSSQLSQGPLQERGLGRAGCLGWVRPTCPRRCLGEAATARPQAQPGRHLWPLLGPAQPPDSGSLSGLQSAEETPLAVVREGHGLMGTAGAMAAGAVRPLDLSIGPHVLSHLWLDLPLGHLLSCLAGPQTLFPLWLGSGHWIKANTGGSNRLYTIQNGPHKSPARTSRVRTSGLEGPRGACHCQAHTV